MMNLFRVSILLILLNGMNLNLRLRKAKTLIILNQVKKYRKNNIELTIHRHYQALKKNQQIQSNL